jgi:hypothetical protein
MSVKTVELGLPVQMTVRLVLELKRGNDEFIRVDAGTRC